MGALHDKLIAFGRQLQSLGYQVGENPAFGGVTAGAHVPGSLHYLGNAIDVNADGHGQAYENAKLNTAAKLARADGFRVLWQVPGHYNHAHIDTGGPLGPSSITSAVTAPSTSTAAGSSSSTTAAPAALGLPSAADLFDQLVPVLFVGVAVLAGGGLIAIGLNKATGNPAGKAAGAGATLAPLLAL